MGLFDFFKIKKEVEASPNLPPIPKDAQLQTGKTTIEYVRLTKGQCNRLNRFFISFDLETTGLSPETDRIIEIGAIAFKDGSPTEEFSTLVNPGKPIPAAATAINGITNGDVKNAPDEKTAILSLLSFIDKFDESEIAFVGHNANFDFSFLKNTLNRLGITRSFQYFDTLHASRSLIKGLPDYKQSTVANYLGLINEKAHRAASDAKVCGNILLQLASEAKKDLNEFVLEPKNIPSKEEMIVCAYIQNLLMSFGANPGDFTYYKNSSGYVTIDSLYEVARFKFAKKGNYFIVNKSALQNFENPTESCTTSEGGANLSRAYFAHPAQLDVLQHYFLDKYKSTCESRDSFFESFPLEKELYESRLSTMLQISEQTMNQLLNEADTIFANVKPSIKMDPEITREMVTINVEVTRKPLSKIRNKNNWERGFNQGYPLFEEAEERRKNGSEPAIREAISLMDQARENGYNSPLLYCSYAKAYRKLKDYQNEILICEEGISRYQIMKEQKKMNVETCDGCVSELTARRNKAIQLLYKQQNL